ncbi:hypothetical protein ACQ859_15145 [Roseateles chitinivorans]|uniref:hypothetical protein n=1 Tax=Roseateles chitinivorans TaxID=2917965 RepID=UPI003D66FDC2
MKISERARQGFDQFVQHCMRTTLVPAGQTETGITALDAVMPEPASSARAASTAPRVTASRGVVVMLTVASSSFSLVLFLHHEVDAAARARLAAQHGLDPAETDGQAVEDAMSEAGNLFCGALNRELGRVFPLVGMSTPHRLDGHCIDHLRLLRHSHVRHFRMTLSDGSHRLASYCVCAYGDIDFVAPPAVVEDVSVGELELF